MAKRLYVITRDLHLYVSLFLSPFILLFAISVFFLLHGRSGREQAVQSAVISDLPAVDGLERLSGRDQVNGVRPLLDRLGVSGEINFIRRIPKDHRLVIAVMIPGRETTVDLNLPQRSATISQRNTGLADALNYLHKMPGPHNVNIRGNSFYMGAWRWLADASAYGVLFLTFSGVYLWTALRAERRVGIVLLSTGAISFFGLIYAISR